MSIVIAHLTDLHIKTAADPILSRADLIARAIASEVGAETKAVVLAIGGDSAFAGTPEQFEYAREFYFAIRKKLQCERPNAQIQIVVVAGNHDCDFSEEGASMAATAPSPGSPEALQRFLGNYFTFESSLALSYTGHSIAAPYIAWCDINIDNDICRLLLVNTSVFSTLHESPGSLKLPIEGFLPRVNPPANCVISVLHHPWNWFSQPDTMRPLRDWVEKLSDIILTGHEHTPETVHLTRDDSISSVYISGGVLQETAKPQESSFVVLKVDLGEKTPFTVTFTLNESGFYERTKTSDRKTFTGNPMRLGRPSDLRDTFKKELDDLGFVIHHPRKQFLTLSDMFVYPDLLLVDEPTSTSTKQLKGKDVDAVILGKERVLISGGDKSGKTCLAKSLFRSAYGCGRSPIVLDGVAIQTRKPSTIRDYVRRAVRDQYLQLQPDQYEQVDRSARVVIVDDFDLMVDNPEIRQGILKELEQMFSCVILIGAETYCFDLFKSDSGHESHLWQYTHYNILSFGEVLREQFIRKWLTLGSEGHPVADVRENTARLSKVINGVIRKTLIPCYPLFLMIVLQQAESGQPTVRGGSYGHLFEAVVTAILNRSTFTKVSISAKHRYLGKLAFELHQRNQAAISKSDALALHQAYWRAIGATVDFDRMIDDLVELNILQLVGDRISFRYKYHYCFFVAYYLSENINDQAIRHSIRQLCSQLYHRETGDILLFLSHLSNDPIVPDEMLSAAERLLERAPEANFRADVANLNLLEKTAPALALPDGSPEQRRLQNLEHQDEQVDGRSSTEADGALLSARPTSTDGLVLEALQLPAAFKTIQILGQFARNHADSLPVEIKQRVMSSLFKLAKRLMGGFLGALNSGLPAIADELAESFKKDTPDIARDDLVKQIGRHVFGMSQLSCFVVTKYVSGSVAHELLEPMSQDLATQMRDLPTQFFDLGISLEKPGYIDLDRLHNLRVATEDNPFAWTLLRMLVLHHMYLFNVNYKIHQAACDELKISRPKGTLNQQHKRLKK